LGLLNLAADTNHSVWIIFGYFCGHSVRCLLASNCYLGVMAVDYSHRSYHLFALQEPCVGIASLAFNVL
jgi:hypothetical protein